MQSLDQLLKQKDVPDNKHEAFKIGFTEGFMRSQALTQKSQGMCAILQNDSRFTPHLADISDLVHDCQQNPLSLTLLCSDRLTEENKVDRPGPSSYWYLWLVENPVSLG